ncbi:MAG: T9SS type A sorting domain-containing protein [Flavobacteriales bacterium]|nr:T9SS type A sorting domain-containing protein [Flavobacteriales bacterium]
MKKLITICYSLFAALQMEAQYYSVVDTYAGESSTGLLDGPLETALFDQPYSLDYDPATGAIYVADAYNHCIRKILNGMVTTLAGNGEQGDANGQGASARFYLPTGIDFNNGYVYVSDNGNNKIKRIDSGGQVTTFAGSGTPGWGDGAASSAQFRNPTEVRVNSTGIVFVADYGNHTIRRIEGGMVSTHAGDPGSAGDMLGLGNTARFNSPTGMAFDDNDNLYVADQVNCKVKKIAPDGTVSLLAGSGSESTVNGTGAAASFMRPTYMGWDPSGALMVGEWAGNVIRRVTLNGVVNTVAGTGAAGYLDGPVGEAQFNAPYGICVDNAGNGYIGDKYNNRIRILYKDGNEPMGLSENKPTATLPAFPNPAIDRITIDLSSVTGKVEAFDVFDQRGVRVMSIAQVVGEQRSALLTLPVDRFASGTYHVGIRSGGANYVSTFIKE